MECGKAPSGVRKAKKKQVKDELDRIKQAEKKKRRLEKALATSAAIISELEKKKQKKKEEQQRLDEEGAAIAEAVALQVLIGEDSDESSCEVMMEKNEEFNPWECCASSFDLFVGSGSAAATAAVIPHPNHPPLSSSPNEEIAWVSNTHGGSRCQWNRYGWADGGSFVSDIRTPYFVDGLPTEISAAGLFAAQAVSSLQITDDDDVDAFVLDRMMRG